MESTNINVMTECIIDGFNALKESTEMLEEITRSLRYNMAKAVLASQMEKCHKYATRYIEGSFFLRRYWKKKTIQEFDKLSKMLEELEPIINSIE